MHILIISLIITYYYHYCSPIDIFIHTGVTRFIEKHCWSHMESYFLLFLGQSTKYFTQNIFLCPCAELQFISFVALLYILLSCVPLSSDSFSIFMISYTTSVHFLFTLFFSNSALYRFYFMYQSMLSLICPSFYLFLWFLSLHLPSSSIPLLFSSCMSRL